MLGFDQNEYFVAETIMNIVLTLEVAGASLEHEVMISVFTEDSTAQGNCSNT